MSRKENALDLAKFIDKGVRVKLSGGREGMRYAMRDLGFALTFTWPEEPLEDMSCLQWKGF